MTLGVIVFAGSWLLISTLLVLDLIGVLNRGTAFRWQATGLLISNSAMDISGFAHLHSWIGNQIGALQSITFPAMFAGLAMVVIGPLIHIGSRRKEQQEG
jgi:hypothetical protein